MMNNLKTITQMKQTDFKGSTVYKYLTMKDIKYILRSGIIKPALVNDEGYHKFYINDVANSISKLSLEQIDALVKKERAEDQRVFKGSAFIKEWNDIEKQWEGGQLFHGVITENRFIYVDANGNDKKYYLNLDRNQYGITIMNKEEVFSVIDVSIDMVVGQSKIHYALKKLDSLGINVDEHCVYYDTHKWIDNYLVNELKNII